MRRCLLLLLTLSMLSVAPCEAGQSSARAAGRGADAVSWVFDTRDDRQGNPRGRVFLAVGGRRVLLLRNATARFRVLDRREYEERGVPGDAVTACSGWWAGQGEDLYVVRRRRQLIVYIRHLDEQAAPRRYRRLKVIPLPR